MHAGAPLTSAELEAKFARLVDPAIAPALTTAVRSLDAAESTAELSAVLRRSSP